MNQIPTKFNKLKNNMENNFLTIKAMLRTAGSILLICKQKNMAISMNRYYHENGLLSFYILQFDYQNFNGDLSSYNMIELNIKYNYMEEYQLSILHKNIYLLHIQTANGAGGYTHFYINDEIMNDDTWYTIDVSEKVVLKGF